MPVPTRGIPRYGSFLRTRPFARTKSSPRAVVCAEWSLRGSVVLAVAALAWICAGTVRRRRQPTPAIPSRWRRRAKPLFELPSAWDAPEPWRTDRFYFQFAYYTLHFHYDPDHQQSYLVDAEYHFKETWLGGQWIAGLALFQNSFGQFSQYIFGGLVWRPIEDNQPFYVKLTAGPLHGYSGQYQNKIPFNSHGHGAGDHSRHRVLREALLRRVRAAGHQRGAVHDRHDRSLDRGGARCPVRVSRHPRRSRLATSSTRSATEYERDKSPSNGRQVLLLQQCAHAPMRLGQPELDAGVTEPCARHRPACASWTGRSRWRTTGRG